MLNSFIIQQGFDTLAVIFTTFSRLLVYKEFCPLFFKLLVSISSHLKSVKLFFLPPGARFELQKWHAGWFTTSMKQNRHNIPPHRLFIANNKDFTINQIYMYLLWNWSNQNTNMGKRIHMSFHYLISYLSLCYKGT